MENTSNQKLNNFASKIIAKIDRVIQKYFPDPFILAILLSLLVMVLAGLFTNTKPMDLPNIWYKNIWSLLSFTMQMALILITGYTLAQTPLFKGLLDFVVKKLNTPLRSIVGVTLITCFCSLINWGLGLVAGAIVSRQIIQLYPQLNFKRLVASSYSGFIVWHGGLSGSIPLAVNSPKNFSIEFLGTTLPLSQTLFSPINLIALFGLLIILPLTNWLLTRNDTAKPTHINANRHNEEKTNEPEEYFSDRANKSKLLTVLFCLFAGSGIILYSIQNEFKLSLNTINFLFLFIGFALFMNPLRFANTFSEGTSKVGPILLQYPLYAGVMGLMKESGLAGKISERFASASLPELFPLMSFLSAGLINIFVPSGGGQWVVQAPVMLPAASELGVSLSATTMAIAWGDAWTNLLQPFWALPLLSIVGLNTKDIMGHLLTILLVSGLYLSLIFAIVPNIL